MPFTILSKSTHLRRIHQRHRRLYTAPDDGDEPDMFGFEFFLCIRLEFNSDPTDWIRTHFKVCVMGAFAMTFVSPRNKKSMIQKTIIDCILLFFVVVVCAFPADKRPFKRLVANAADGIAVRRLGGGVEFCFCHVISYSFLYTPT